MKKLILSAMFLLGCDDLEGLKNKHIRGYQQPKCDVQTVISIPDSPGLIWGDGLGEKKAKEVAKQMDKTCPECLWVAYAGDIYTWGVNSIEERREKVGWVQGAFGHRKLVHVMGNHGVYGKPELLVGQHYMPCHTYSAVNDWIHIQVIDTNAPKSAEWGICSDSKRVRALFGHHPLESATTKDRADQRTELLEALGDHPRRCADVYLSGHDHLQSVIVKDGLNHILSGAGGRDLTKVDQTYPGLVWGNGSVHGFAVIRPGSPKHFSIEFYSDKGVKLHTSHF
jgi:hypothetical protein